MRPNTSVPESSQYECPSCGARASDPDDRTCSDCGTSMRYLGHSRDL
ncbi:rubrerythrin-like domain-containing protein [Halomicrobium zhouii]|nr:rubrerythrin-like domain-containing protein [Halomicrobium zhouii]